MRRDYERAKAEQFLKRIADIYRVSMEEARRFATGEPGSSLRINRLSPKPAEEILGELEAARVELDSIPWCADAFFLRSPKREVSEGPLFQGGHVYLQNASSLVPPLALAPQPGNSILDVCAAPGGKAAHLAALVGNDCELWVNDAIKPRLEKLRQVLDLFHVHYDSLTGHPGQYLTKEVDRQFDRILLDAQCSGEGMVDLSHPQALRFWDPERITKLSYLQRKMLVSAFRLLKPGGVLVYSTCTFAPEENEEPVDHLLRHHPEATVEPLGLDLPGARGGLKSWKQRNFDPRLKDAVRILPSESMEAFFVCRLRKAG